MDSTDGLPNESNASRAKMRAGGDLKLKHSNYKDLTRTSTKHAGRPADFDS